MNRLEYKTEDHDGNTEIAVLLDGEEVYRWYDCAQSEYPEDLCWHRMISEVFEKVQTLTIPAAEYVPAIGDVFDIIDNLKKVDCKSCEGWGRSGPNSCPYCDNGKVQSGEAGT